MQQHLDEGIFVCNLRQPAVLILSGGFSAMRSMPGRSEARSMYDYVKPRLRYEPIVLRDEDSLTTLDNIRNAAAKLRQRGFDPREMLVTFWCDRSRKRTIEIVGRSFFGNALKVMTSSAKVVKDPWTKNFAAMLITMAAAKSSFVDERFRTMRKKHFAES